MATADAADRPSLCADGLGAYAASVEEAFGYPIKVDHLQAMAEVPGVFASVSSDLKRDLAGQP